MSMVELKSTSCDIPIVRDPERAYTIPARYYLDSDIFQQLYIDAMEPVLSSGYLGTELFEGRPQITSLCMR